MSARDSATRGVDPAATLVAGGPVFVFRNKINFVAPLTRIGEKLNGN